MRNSLNKEIKKNTTALILTCRDISLIENLIIIDLGKCPGPLFCLDDVCVCVAVHTQI